MANELSVLSNDGSEVDHAPDIALLVSKAREAEARYKAEIYHQHGPFFDFHQDVGCKHFGKSDCGYWMQ